MSGSCPSNASKPTSVPSPGSTQWRSQLRPAWRSSAPRPPRPRPGRWLTGCGPCSTAPSLPRASGSWSGRWSGRRRPSGVTSTAWASRVRDRRPQCRVALDGDGPGCCPKSCVSDPAAGRALVGDAGPAPDVIARGVGHADPCVISLADAAGLASTLDADRSIRLPFPDADEGEARRGRKIGASEVLRVADRAAISVATLSASAATGFAADHMARLERVLDGLGWQRDTPAADPVFGAIDRLASELPENFDLGRGEVLEAARRRLGEVGLEAVGGAGGGVQLLSAMEARGRTFDHLFLAALNRGRFPRVVQEDPLLPDTVRGHLAAEVLPEFPVKARGLDEERYLFAQLVGRRSTWFCRGGPPRTARRRRRRPLWNGCGGRSGSRSTGVRQRSVGGSWPPGRPSNTPSWRPNATTGLG